MKNKLLSKQLQVSLKGFAMGVADIVPGVSGGTVAFITGIYDQLLESISSVNLRFIQFLFRFEIKQALGHIQFNFLFPLFCGIIFAILSTSRLMHFLLENYAVYTWSTFFGLIAASIYFVGKQVEQLTHPKNTLSLLLEQS